MISNDSKLLHLTLQAYRDLFGVLSDHLESFKSKGNKIIYIYYKHVTLLKIPVLFFTLLVKHLSKLAQKKSSRNKEYNLLTINELQQLCYATMGISIIGDEHRMMMFQLCCFAKLELNPRFLIASKHDALKIGFYLYTCSMEFRQP